MAAWVGTSGWQYEDWRDRFYPPGLAQARWLAQYARTFASVEVNGSFYHLPRRETVERWAASVPHGFVLAFKASRYITHVRRLLECEEPLRRMWGVFQGAGGKLGPVLFQLPPNLPADLDRLAAFVGMVPEGMRAAFEFRHPSWRTEAAADILDASGCALVHADRPGVRAAEIRSVGGWSYVRFHQGRSTAPGYERRKLRSYAERIAALGEDETFAYFNNDTGGAAVRDARTLIDLLAERGVNVAGV
jgi:uncharacterized protein YecE (DUF72 family)